MRIVFAYASHPEVYLDADNVRDMLPARPLEPANIETRLATLRDATDEMVCDWDSALASLDAATREEVCCTLIEQTAPLAATLGVALQSLSAPSVFEDTLHLQLMALLADDIGVGAVECSRFNHFQDIARSHGLTSVTGAPRELSDQRHIRNGVFRLPALIYAMSRRSDVFDYELIGIDLAWRVMGLFPAWRTLSANDARWRGLDLGRGRGAALNEGASLAGLALKITHEIARDDASKARICHGITLFKTLIADLDGLLTTIVGAIRNPRLAMAILIQDRAREARVYHDNYKLDGRPLSEWFDEAQNDPIPLINALGRSKLVRQDKPERSFLINGLLSENGSMFRIFNEKDVAIIRRWIESLPDSAEDDGICGGLPNSVRLQHDLREVRSGDLDQGVWPKDARTAYHLLQGRALAPRSKEFAKAYCDFWLGKSRDSVDKCDRSLPQTWRPGDLREWLLSSHDSHADAFDSSKGAKIPSREAVIDQTIQLAPLTLIDGAWLQGFTDISLASSRVGAPLFETYWDELGNGEWLINHPKIYRDVLSAMGITLPPTGSRAFAEYTKFREESYRLPVYWLCLGKLPITLRPEILGMNLAMELSGVGGAYRSARTFLKRYGFPTTFVDIHNTIDNVSTGHSAWAADAIDAYVQETKDIVPIDQTWERIRLGYESLAPITDNPETLNFFATPVRDTVPLHKLSALLHSPLQHMEVAE